jgi:hypothetical protein
LPSACAFRRASGRSRGCGSVFSFGSALGCGVLVALLDALSTPSSLVLTISFFLSRP